MVCHVEGPIKECTSVLLILLVQDFALLGRELFATVGFAKPFDPRAQGDRDGQ